MSAAQSIDRCDAKQAEKRTQCGDSGEKTGTPQTCITGGASSKGESESGGIDTLALSVFGFWHPEQWRETRQKFMQAKEAAQNDVVGTPVEITNDQGDSVWVGPGSASMGQQCKFVMTWQGNRICIVDRPAPSDTHANVYVEIGSAYLMAYGHETAYDNVKALLNAFGFEWDRETVSRVDLCTDHAGIAPHDFYELGKHKICQARLHTPKHDMDEVFCWYIGADGAKMLCRIYDKVREMMKKSDLVKVQLMRDNRWGGEIPDISTRVEFQFRTEPLRELGVTTFRDLCNKLDKLARYATHEWLRFSDRPVDRKNKNQSHYGVHKLWRTVQDAFRKWTGNYNGLPPRRRKNLGQGCVKQLAQQASGVLAALAARSGQAFDTASDCLAWVHEQIPELTNSFPVRLTSKLDQLSRSSPGVYIDEAEIPF